MAQIKININKLMKKFLPKILKAMMIDFSIGSAVGITNAKIQGKETNINPLDMTKKDQKAFTEQIETLISDVNSDIAKKLSYLTNKSVTDRWSTPMLAEEISKLGIEETYKNRYKTIAQDLSFDLMSTGSHNTSTRLGATSKWIYNVMDGKTADDSKYNASKFGTPEKAIPIDKPFRYTWKGKERVFMYGRDRPRDRSQTIYEFDEGKEK